MKYRIMGATGLNLLLALVIVRPAAAITVDEVIGLAAAGSSDSVIMAKIDSDATVFHLTVGEILELKEKGVSDVVITYMINTGKAGETGTVLEPEEDTGPPAEGDKSGDDGGDGGGGGDVSIGFGFDSYGNVGFSFGYYYPHWPGYWYSYYYDPFWWPSWCWYGGYWQPYPYYHWYYDPWYACNAYYPGYYDHCYYNDYYPGYGYEDGRNVGSRGPTDGYDRVIKGGETAASRANLDQARASTRMKEPGAEMAAQNKSGSPNRNAIRTPESRTSASKVQRPERSKVRTPQYVRGTNRGSNSAYRSRTRTQPGRGQDVAVYRSRPTRGRDGRIERSAPSQGEVASTPSRSYQNGSRGYQNGGRSYQNGGRSYQNGGRAQKSTSRSFQGSGRSFQGGGRATPSIGSRGGGGSQGGGFRGGGGGGGRSGKR